MKAVEFSAAWKAAGVAAWKASHKIEPTVKVELYDGTQLAVESFAFDGSNFIIKLGDSDG